VVEFSIKDNHLGAIAKGAVSMCSPSFVWEGMDKCPKTDGQAKAITFLVFEPRADVQVQDRS